MSALVMSEPATRRRRLALPLALKDTAAKVGGVSIPTKMPWYSYSLPTVDCIIGSKLRDVEGSVCEGCYAHRRGNYRFTNVQKALKKRLKSLKRSPKLWAKRMSELLQQLALRFVPSEDSPTPDFRWHDSGDLQGAWHLRAILEVARNTQHVLFEDGTSGPVRHWLPTREYGFVEEVLSTGEPTDMAPPNLTIRLSAHMVGGPLPEKLAKSLGVLVSGVHVATIPKVTSATTPNVSFCPAYQQGGKCGTCRTCWSDTFAVSYPKH